MLLESSTTGNELDKSYSLIIKSHCCTCIKLSSTSVSRVCWLDQ